ncbi:MAG: hypothetical protein ABJH05_11105 [Fulvivirga sp.]
MIKHLILFASLLLASAAAAQTQEDQILQQVRDQEHARNAAIMRKMDQGVDSMNIGSYQVAEKLFREVLKEAKVVPTDLTFYFGKNSYLLEKYQQSIDWLNKYIEIKGTSGRYYEETIQLLGHAKNAFLKIRSEERKEASQLISSSNYEIDCGPSGKVLCPVCRGEGVIIERGAFGNTYRDCPYSDDHGYLTCEEYNQLLRGELEAKN